MSGRLVRAMGALFFLLAAAAGAGQDGTVRAADTAGFLELRGFRIKPPPGDDWVLVERDDARVFFGKRTGALTHTFVALAFTEILPDSAGVGSLAEFFEFINGIVFVPLQ